MPDLDEFLCGRLLPDQLPGPRHGIEIDVRPDEAPAVLGIPDQRINTTGADSDIEHPNGRAVRNRGKIFFGEQVGEMVNVVRPTRNCRAQRAGWNIPIEDPVMEFQQRPIQRFDRLGVREIDRVATARVRRDEPLQLRASVDQRGKIISFRVPIPRMRLSGAIAASFRMASWRHAFPYHEAQP